ncbi:phosphotransferase family protein [Rhodococcus erythropolis]|uniref:phosphotransferase family protein n=1 Tax=Rhodococcus erythropolis TaxID=1833 RepID=UPI00087917CC|nr:phosphotransferase family protein [Rhodococcus erythropolis]
MSEALRYGINLDLISRWMDELGVDHTGPLHLDRIGLGQSNLTFLVVDSRDREWVLRRPPLGQLLASAHDVLREARILDALLKTSVPVPKILGWTDDPDVVGAPVVLMEYVDGLVVDRMEVAHRLTFDQRERIGFALPDALAKIHSIEPAAVGLGQLTKSKTTYATRQLRRWSEQWQHSRTREIADLDDLTRRLWDAIPDQKETTLVHGDFHLLNVIMSPEMSRVSAVLDWELCTLGDPLADLGTLLAYWPAEGEQTGALNTMSTLPGFPTRSELIDCYLEKSRRSGDDLGFWHALGLWKIAVIAEGALRRTDDNPDNRSAAEGSAVEWAPTVEWIDSLVENARDVAAKAGI